MYLVVWENTQSCSMDNGCSKCFIQKISYFLSLKALHGGGISFGNGKKGYILGVGKIVKSLSDAIKDMYYVIGLYYSFLSVTNL